MATVSKVKIANLALSNIGARSSIESLDELSAEAKQCKLWYDFAREMALEAYDWSFARKRQTLAAHSDDPPSGVWGYRYQYPSDCVKLRYLVNPLGPDADPVPFEVESSLDGSTKTILTDLEDAVAVYTWNLEQTALFSIWFVQTMAAALGYFTAFSLTGKTTIQQVMLDKFNVYLAAAEMHDANERVGAPPREAEAIRARA